MCSCSFYIKIIIHLLSNVGISASQHLKPSSDSLDSIHDVIPLVPDPDETDDSTANNQLHASKRNNDEPVANNGLDVSQQIINEPKDLTTNNGLDVSRQKNDEPVDSTTNNELDVSKQNYGISPIDPSLGIL